MTSTIQEEMWYNNYMVFTIGHKINKGRIQSDIHRQNGRIAKLGKNNPMFGKKRSKETLDKVSASIKAKGLTDERSRKWKGDKVKYSGLHYWVRKHLGRPMKCEMCGSEKENRYEWANVDHKYKRRLEDWIRLCCRCHYAYDCGMDIRKSL